jgi:hypothetical protein
VTDPSEIDRIRPALFGRFPDIPAWMAEEYANRDSAGLLRWFRIRPTLLTGRAGGVRPR